MDESLGAFLTRVRLASGRSQLRVAQLLCAAAGGDGQPARGVPLGTGGAHPSPFWLHWLALVLEVNLAELERAAAVTRRTRPAAGVDRPAPPTRRAGVPGQG